MLAVAGILIALDAIALLMAVGAMRQGTGMKPATIAYGAMALVCSILLLAIGNWSESFLLAVFALIAACLPLVIVILPGLARMSNRS